MSISVAPFTSGEQKRQCDWHLGTVTAMYSKMPNAVTEFSPYFSLLVRNRHYPLTCCCSGWMKVMACYMLGWLLIRKSYRIHGHLQVTILRGHARRERNDMIGRSEGSPCDWVRGCCSGTSRLKAGVKQDNWLEMIFVVSDRLGERQCL